MEVRQERPRAMTAPMNIQVNGEPRTAETGSTVGDLLRELDIRPDRVAVELNSQILDRQELGQRGLHEGDRIEIIGFIGGGAGIKEASSTVSPNL